MSENASVVIVGGSSGVGFALAQACVKRGDDVIVCGRSAERTRLAAE